MPARPRAQSVETHTLVLDNEAVQVLADPGHGKHRAVLRFIEAAATRNRRRGGAVALLAPTVVRVEAGLDRRAAPTVSLARLRVDDVALDTPRANRAAALRHAGGSSVDACVVEVAASVTAGIVTVLTADFSDIPRLLAAAMSPAVVYRV